MTDDRRIASYAWVMLTLCAACAGAATATVLLVADPGDIFGHAFDNPMCAMLSGALPTVWVSVLLCAGLALASRARRLSAPIIVVAVLSGLGLLWAGVMVGFLWWFIALLAKRRFGLSVLAGMVGIACIALAPLLATIGWVVEAVRRFVARRRARA